MSLVDLDYYMNAKGEVAQWQEDRQLFQSPDGQWNASVDDFEPTRHLAEQPAGSVGEGTR